MKQIRSAIIVNTLNNFDVLVTTIETNLIDITRHTYKSWLTSYPHITETLEIGKFWENLKNSMKHYY